jgi:hypothetical protein
VVFAFTVDGSEAAVDAVYHDDKEKWDEDVVLVQTRTILALLQFPLRPALLISASHWLFLPRFTATTVSSMLGTNEEGCAETDEEEEEEWEKVAVVQGRT